MLFSAEDPLVKAMLLRKIKNIPLPFINLYLKLYILGSKIASIMSNLPHIHT